MNTLLITGIDTVVGSNLAVCFSKKYRVIGINQGSTDFQTLAGCKTILDIREDAESIRNCLKQHQPAVIIHCGAASVPTWQQNESSLLDSDSIDSVKNWAEVSSELNIPLTVISSDGLFTGPWMFHKEDCSSLCSSPEAQMLISFEKAVQESNEDALLVRTHAYGWNPESLNDAWIENIIENLESPKPATYSSTRHASPILVEDLAERLEKAWEEKLTGICHISGAERVSPQDFVEKLAVCFGLTFPSSSQQECLNKRPIGYGLGETSLNCSLFREMTGTGFPMLQDGLEKLNTQKSNGYLKKLNTSQATVSKERVA